MAMIPLASKALATPPSNVPNEVIAATPKGMSLLAFKSSGPADGADAAAVYETSPNADGIRYRTLTLFERKGGRFVPEVSNAKVIACSKCSQFHGDPFDADYLDVKRHHIHLIQMDSGEKPSTTTLDFSKQEGAWRVTNASRFTSFMGRYESKTEKLALPPSGLLKDMDARWSVPMYLNTLVVNQKNDTFMFLHGDLSQASVRKHMEDECHDNECAIVAQQHDGCISLVSDASKRWFSGSTTNPKAREEAISNAVAACKASGGKACKAVRTDCSIGILSGDE